MCFLSNTLSETWVDIASQRTKEHIFKKKRDLYLGIRLSCGSRLLATTKIWAGRLRINSPKLRISLFKGNITQLSLLLQ